VRGTPWRFKSKQPSGFEGITAGSAIMAALINAWRADNFLSHRCADLGVPS